MYQEYYGLDSKPFQISSDPAFMWLGEKHKEALATLTYGVLDNKGFMLLTGDVGTGKTTLVNTLIKNLSDDIIYAFVPDPRLKLSDFLNYIARAFGIDGKYKSKGRFLIDFSDFLEKAYSDKKKVLLLIDEAQLLTQDLLEEIRLLSNIQKDGNNLLNIFFIGQHEFNEILDRQENRAVAQRLTLNYHIAPLSETETGKYIRHRLHVAGRREQLFDDSAVREIHAYSGGFPRRINIICDHCLLNGFVKEKKIIDAEIVRICAHDLKIPKYTGRPLPPPRPVPPQPQYQPPPDLQSSPQQPAQQTMTAPYVDSRRESKVRMKMRSPNYVRVGSAFAILCAGLLFFYYSAPELFMKAASGLGEQVIMFQKQAKQQSPAAPKDTLEDIPAKEPKERVDPKVSESRKKTDGRKKSPDGEQQERPEAAVAKKTGVVKPVPTAVPDEMMMLAEGSKAPAPERKWMTADLMNQSMIVHFDHNSSDFYFSDTQHVEGFVKEVKKRPNVVVIISGHTDSQGSEGYNYRLSLFRANMLKSFFLGKGVKPYQLKVRGFGSKVPVASNDTPEGRKQNRRVEIAVLR